MRGKVIAPLLLLLALTLALAGSVRADPGIFGYDNIASDHWEHIHGIEGAAIVGTKFTLTEDGIAENIYVYISSTWTTLKVGAAIYEQIGSVLYLIENTQPQTTQVGEYWMALSFLDPKPELPAGDYFLLATVVSAPDPENVKMVADTVAENIGVWKFLETGYGFPENISGFVFEHYKYSIYCVYTPVFWQEVDTWTNYLHSPAWQEVEVWINYLDMKEWQEVEAWVSYLNVPAWQEVEVWTDQIGVLVWIEVETWVNQVDAQLVLEWQEVENWTNDLDVSITLEWQEVETWINCIQQANEPPSITNLYITGEGI